jgi:hypothetical protein
MPARKTLFKTWLKAALALVFSLLVLAYAFLYGLTQTDWLKNSLQSSLGAALHGEVRIEALSLHLRQGLLVRGVDVALANKGSIHTDRLAIRCNLIDLLQKKITIATISLNGAEMTIHLQESSETEASEVMATLAALVDKFAVSVHELGIRDSNLAIFVDDQPAVTLEGLQLHASVEASRGLAQIEGALASEALVILAGGHEVRTPVSLAIVARVDFVRQDLDLQRLDIEAGAGLMLRISGRVRDFLRAREVALSLRDSRIVTEEIIALVGGRLPEKIKGLGLAGVLHPVLTGAGAWSADGFSGVVNGELLLTDFQAGYPGMSAVLKGSLLRAEITDGVISNNGLDTAKIHLGLEHGEAAVAGLTFAEAVIDLVVALDKDGPLTGSLRFKSDPAHLSLQKYGTTALPLALALEFVGNYRTETFAVQKAMVQAGPLGKFIGQGHLGPTADGRGERQVGLQGELWLGSRQLLQYLAAPIPPNYTLHQGAEPAHLAFNASGRLGPDFTPRRAALSGTFMVPEFSGTVTTPRISAEVSGLTGSFQAEYQGDGRRLTGSGHGEGKLARVVHEGSTTLEEVGVTLDANLQGKVTGAFALAELASTDFLAVKIKKAATVRPSMAVDLADIAILATVRTDMVGHEFYVDDLRLTAGDLLQAQGAGSFHGDANRFAAELTVPQLDLPGLLDAVSYSDPAWRRVALTAGKLSLAGKAEGEVPKNYSVAPFALPFAVDVALAAREVAGTIGDYHFDNGGGRVQLTAGPGPGSEVALKGRVALEKVTLPPGRPVSMLAKTFAEFALSAPPSGPVNIGLLHLGAEGLEATVTGELAGLGQLWAGKKDLVQVVLADSHPHLTAVVTVDLAKQAELVESFGIKREGAGVLRLEVSRAAAFQARAVFAGRDISLALPGMKIGGLSGPIIIRKELRWQGGAGRPGPGAEVFVPTDILPGLRRQDNPAGSVRIRALSLGGLAGRNISLVASYDNDTLRFTNLAANLLGGVVGGNIIVRGGVPAGLSITLDGADLDLNQLFPENDRIGGESRISPVLRLDLVFNESPWGIDWGGLDLSLSVTEIGREALDRLLRLVDPRESNPAIVKARARIRYANPSGVAVVIFKGVMNIRIEFQEGVLESLRIDRIPVASLAKIKEIDWALVVLEKFARIVAIMRTDEFARDKAGNFLLR